MKGSGGWFVILSLAGILLGLFMVWHGFNGNGLGSIFVFLIGVFVTIKEILDIFHE